MYLPESKAEMNSILEDLEIFADEEGLIDLRELLSDARILLHQSACLPFGDTTKDPAIADT